MDENDTLDPEDFSHQNEAADMVQLLKHQLSDVQSQLERLSALNFSSKSKVEPGAIVHTHEFSFVIGVVTTPFLMDEKNYIGISTDAAIYREMKEKKPGDAFSYGINHYNIIEIL